MKSSNILTAIQIILIVAIFLMTIIFYREIKKNKISPLKKSRSGFLIGLLTDFGDTLGVGSFATTTVAFKLTNFIEDDRKLPGTLNAVHTIPVFLQALLFVTAVQVDITTLVLMTIAAIAGSIVGPILTKNWDVKLVRRSLAVALLIGAIIIVIRILANPGSHNSENIRGLFGATLWIGIVVNFLLGILMTIGFGNYSPMLIFFSLVGVNPAVAFPVMMLSSALIQPTAVIQFIKQKKIQWEGLISVAAGGIIGVLIATFVVKSLPLQILNWLVVAIALYTSYSLYKESLKK